MHVYLSECNADAHMLAQACNSPKTPQGCVDRIDNVSRVADYYYNTLPCRKVLSPSANKAVCAHLHMPHTALGIAAQYLHSCEGSIAQLDGGICLKGNCLEYPAKRIDALQATQHDRLLRMYTHSVYKVLLK